LERMASGESIAESSIQIGAVPNRPAARRASVVVVAQQAAAQSLRIHQALGAQQPLHQLLLRHFEGEDRDPTLCSMAACCTMLSASAVFPIDGRAATITRSPRWNRR